MFLNARTAIFTRLRDGCVRISTAVPASVATCLPPDLHKGARHIDWWPKLGVRELFTPTHRSLPPPTNSTRLRVQGAVWEDVLVDEMRW